MFCPPPYIVCSWCYWVVRALTNSFLFIVLGGSSYAIYLAVENAHQFSSDENVDIIASLKQGWSGVWQLIQIFQVTTII